MNSNLTPAEQWRLHGAFSEDTAQKLLDLHEAHSAFNAPSMADTLSEIEGCIPGEDFLTPVLRSIALLVKRSRGAGREALQEIFNDLHALHERQQSDTDHASDLIRQMKRDLSRVPTKH